MDNEIQWDIGEYRVAIDCNQPCKKESVEACRTCYHNMVDAPEDDGFESSPFGWVHADGE